MASREHKWEFYQDKAGTYHWRRIASNGNVIGAATQGYVTAKDCKGNAEECSERDESRGARSAATETYRVDRRGSEHRATLRFARTAIYSVFPKENVRLNGYVGN